MTGQEMIQEIEKRAHQDGIAKGIVEGAAEAFTPQLERRLGRPLHEHERARLRERIGSLGSDRVGDVVLDLPADELATWLADPNAR